MGKPVKTVRRTIIVLTYSDIPISTRAMMWEVSARSGERFVHRVERAVAGAGIQDAGDVYLIDAEVTRSGASRHDLTKFVRTYLPEVEYHYITE